MLNASSFLDTYIWFHVVTGCFGVFSDMHCSTCMFPFEGVGFDMMSSPCIFNHKGADLQLSNYLNHPNLGI